MPRASSSYHIKHFKLNILVRSCFYWLCLFFTTLTIQYGILKYSEFSLKWPYWPKSEVKHFTYLLPRRGTGMIASSSTFRPHSGRVIRDLFRLLDAVTALYGSTSLQQSSKGSCSLLVSGYNLRADCQWRTLVPPLNSGANAAPASVLALM